MTTMGNTGVPESERNRPLSLGIVAGGSVAQWLFGAAAGVLAIITLVGFMGTTIGRILMSIAVLSVSAALVFEGGAITGRLGYLLGRANVSGAPRMVSGLSAEFLAGCAGIVLGIIALLGYYPTLLTSCAIVIFGGAIALGGLARELSNVAATNPAVSGLSVPSGNPEYLRFAREAAAISAGTHLLAGLSIITLGIITLLGVNPMYLNMVSILSLGGVLFFEGAAVNGMVAGMFGRRVSREEGERPELRRAA